MKSKRAIRLGSSDKVLEGPNGEPDIEVLEELLEDASRRKLDKNRQIIVTYGERVKDFNPENPDWKEVERKHPLSYLLRLYKRETGASYQLPEADFEEDRERQARRDAARAVYSL
jgi:hypothetical protein